MNKIKTEKDDNLGQTDYLDQPLKNSLTIQQPFLNYDNFEEKTYNSNFFKSFLIDDEGARDFAHGFMSENILGILYTAAFSDIEQFAPDDNYKVYEDEKYARVINNNFKLKIGLIISASIMASYIMLAEIVAKILPGIVIFKNTFLSIPFVNTIPKNNVAKTKNMEIPIP